MVGCCLGIILPQVKFRPSRLFRHIQSMAFSGHLQGWTNGIEITIGARSRLRQKNAGPAPKGASHLDGTLGSASRTSTDGRERYIIVSGVTGRSRCKPAHWRCEVGRMLTSVTLVSHPAHSHAALFPDASIPSAVPSDDDIRSQGPRAAFRQP